jgi:hypothetical protein
MKKPSCSFLKLVLQTGCKFALEQKRFTWRHDSILSLINQALQHHLQTANQKQQAFKKPILMHFVSAGHQTVSSKRSTKFSLLSGSDDWKLIVDLPNSNYIFPPEIYSTAERPDIVIWSAKTKRVLLLELTCPAEEGIEAAKTRKQAKYQMLMENISNNSNWKPLLFTLEIGVRGFIAVSTQQVFLKLGLQRQNISTLLKRLSATAAKCLHAILLAANSECWEGGGALLDS